MNGKSRFTIPLKIVLAVVLVLVCINFLFPKALPVLFTTLVRPLWSFEQGFLNGHTPREELENILNENLSRGGQNSVLLKENEELKALLGRSELKNPLLAVILKRPPFTAYDTFILDVGSNEAVKAGDRVYTLGGIPLGTVEEVMGDTSKVKLFSSSGEKFDVLIGPTHIQTVAVGRGGGFFEATVPRDTKIQVGDGALIPSLTNAFAGTVQGIASLPAEPFSKVLFRQPVNMYEMRWVIVEIRR